MIVRYHPVVRTFAELHERLGQVPLTRIIMDPPPGTATEADVTQYEIKTKRLCELIDGTLVEKAVSHRASVIGMWLGIEIGLYLKQHPLGVLSGEAGGYRLDDGRIRIPDVAFIAWDDAPDDGVPDESFSSLTPALVVEVLSPSNTVAEIAMKREHFFTAGTKLFWVIDPATQTVDVYTSRTRVKRLVVGDALDGGKVLPGFKLAVADMFAERRRPPRKKKG